MDRRSYPTRVPGRIFRRHWIEAAIFALACGLALTWFGVGAGLLMLPFALLGCLLIGERRGGAGLRDARGGAGDALRPLRAAVAARLSSVRKTDASFALVLARIDTAGAGRAAASCVDRLSRVLRDEDLLFDLSQGRLAILLAPGPALDRAALTALGTRLQDALSGQGSVASGTRVALGICMADAGTDRSGRAMIRAAESALAQAAQEGASTIRFHGVAAPDPPRACPETA
jgi:GGDEF domain-containing protein